MSDRVENDLRSFVTFALALKPSVTFHRKPDSRGPELSLTFEVKEGGESKPKFHNIEPLMERYRQLKPYLDVIVRSGEHISNCLPTINFQPNVRYHTIRLTEGEFAIAKETAMHLASIDNAMSSNETTAASAAFNQFQTFLKAKRDHMVGAFKGLQLSNPVASFGAGRVSADGDCTGAVIFVIAEAIVAVPLVEQPAEE